MAGLDTTTGRKGFTSAPRAVEAKGAGASTLRLGNLGVRARLLLAFFGISAFAALAAAAGIYAFSEVGGRLDVVDRRVAPTLSSLELSRSAERIIAAAPALLTATDRQRRDQVKGQLDAEVVHLNGKLLELKHDRTEVLPLLKFEPIVASLTDNLAALEGVVTRRLGATEFTKTLRREVFQTNDETQRLLAAWLLVVNSQIDALVQGSRKAGSGDGAEAAQRLLSLMERRQPAEAAQGQFLATVEMIMEASTTDQPRRLSVLTFQLGRAVHDLETTAAAGLDTKLRLLFLEQVGKLRQFVDGPNAMAGARRQELALITEGEKRLAENASLSAQLTAAVDQLASAAKRDIAKATRDALAVQHLSTRVLLALVALSLLTSGLIVWLYVGRNIVRRLTALSQGMLAIADGRLQVPVPEQGADEIAAMARAVEVFRKNTLERDELLAEKAQVADRLEKEVDQRTAELQVSLEYQTATSKVLDVISRSTFNLQPVLESVVESATRLCGATRGHLLLFDGEFLRMKAGHGTLQGFTEYLESHPIPLGEGSVAGTAGCRRRTVHVSDVLSEPGYALGELVKQQGYRTVLAVPMLREQDLLGVIVILKTHVEPFSHEQIELVETFADQAVIAIENTRLMEEVQSRSRELARSVQELKALGDVGRAVNSTVDLEVVLSTIVAKAVQLSGTEAGTIYVFDEASREFRLRASYGMDDALIAAVKDHPLHLDETSVVSQAALQRAPVQLPDVQHESSSLVLDVILRAGFRALLTIPLLGADRIVGALVVRRRGPGEFPKNTVDLLQTFAAQSVVAIQNAHLFHEIAQKSRELEIASQHKSQFVANMSHELRTPLAAILGYAELMQEGFYGALSEKSMASLTRIRSNGKHLLGLINTVLDIAKIESGQFSLTLADYALESVVETVRVATESLAETKKLSLKTDVAKRLPIGLGDEQRLTQVLLNLVGNAIKFTDTGEVRITATAVNGHFTVGVTDTGPGIPAQELNRVFEQFHQVDSSNTKAKGGTGLGLAIAKQIVEMHGGRIWVESTLGKGATFQMELPIRAGNQKGPS